MLRLTALAVLGLAVVAWAAATGGTTATTCTPGVTRINGVRVLVFCGPAKATVKFSGKSIEFRNGTCQLSKRGTFSVNVGRATLGRAKPKFTYFGISISKARRDGTYKGAAIGFQWRRKSYSVLGNTVKLRDRHTRGTFSGRLGRAGSARVTGSFSCVA